MILETGELVTYDNVRRASWLAMLAGGDFIKTSPARSSPAATLPVTLVMLEAVRDWREVTGAHGRGQAGGRHPQRPRTRMKHLVIVNETAGEDWLDPAWFRFGASEPARTTCSCSARSSRTGAYSGADYVTID